MLTKTDKLDESDVYLKALAVGHRLKAYDNILDCLVLCVSSNTGFGIEHLKYSLTKAFLENYSRDLKGNEELLLAKMLGHNLAKFD